MLKLVESHYVSAEEVQPEVSPSPLPHKAASPLRRKNKDVLADIERRREIETTLNNDCTTSGEQALWRAVITQALMDAGSQSTKREAKFHRAQSIAWFSKNNPNFQLVCALAGLDPNYVFERAHKAIRQECKWRKAPNEGQKNKR